MQIPRRHLRTEKQWNPFDLYFRQRRGSPKVLKNDVRLRWATERSCPALNRNRQVPQRLKSPDAKTLVNIAVAAHVAKLAVEHRS